MRQLGELIESLGPQPSTGPKELNELFKFLQISERAKQTWQAESWVYRRYYDGLQYYVVRRGRTGDTQIGVDTELVDACPINICASVIDLAQSTILQKNHSLEGLARTGDRSDVRSAEVLTQILKDHDYRNLSRTRIRETVQRVLVEGNHFIRVSYDPTAPVFVTVPPEIMETLEGGFGVQPLQWSKLPNGTIRAEIPAGATTEHPVPASLVFVESGPTEWADVEKFAVADYMSVGKARRLFPQYADKIKPMQVMTKHGADVRNAAFRDDPFNSTMSSQYNGDGFDSDQNVTRVVEYWIRSGHTWDRVVTTGYSCEILLAEDRGLLINPYVRYDCKFSGDPWYKPLMKDMYAAQYAVNVIAAQQLGYLAKGIKDVVMTPFGSDVSPITSDYALHVQFDPNFGAPIFKPMDPTVLQILSGLKNEFIAQVEKLGQINSVAMGQVQPRTSRFAVQAAVEAAASPLMDIRARIMEAERCRAQKVAAIAQEKYDWPRIATITGDMGSTSITEFSNADIIAGTDVQIVDSDTSDRSMEMRLDAAIALAQHGLFSDMPEMENQRKRLIQFYKSGSFEDLSPTAERQNVDRALVENEMMMTGKAMLLPPEIVADMTGEDMQTSIARVADAATLQLLLDDSDLDAVHIEEHMIEANKPATRANPQVRALIMAHAAEHRQRVFQRQEEEKQMHLEMKREEALADATGVMATTMASAKATNEAKAQQDVIKNPTFGGVQSGIARS
jgi:hypothetical protein